MNSIVVHYQELALKGKNRPWFLGRLVRHLRTAVSDLDVTTVRALMGRIEIVLGPSAPVEAVSERVRHTFGVANFSLAGRSPLDLDVIAQAILRDLGDRSCRTFRVSARRADKRYPLTSPQVEREVGGRIKEARAGRWIWTSPSWTSGWSCSPIRSSTSSARIAARADCRPGRRAAWHVCCRAASIRPWRRTG